MGGHHLSPAVMGTRCAHVKLHAMAWATSNRNTLSDNTVSDRKPDSNAALVHVASQSAALSCSKFISKLATSSVSSVVQCGCLQHAALLSAAGRNAVAFGQATMVGTKKYRCDNPDQCKKSFDTRRAKEAHVIRCRHVLHLITWAAHLLACQVPALVSQRLVSQRGWAVKKNESPRGAGMLPLQRHF